MAGGWCCLVDRVDNCEQGFDGASMGAVHELLLRPSPRLVSPTAALHGRPLEFPSQASDLVILGIGTKHRAAKSKAELKTY